MIQGAVPLGDMLVDTTLEPNLERAQRIVEALEEMGWTVGDDFTTSTGLRCRFLEAPGQITPGTRRVRILITRDAS